ncbi:sigma-70 region 4 domain-containing protein [Streptomyces sp. NBC_00557]|uniref:sigma-70 region 4 domain-containing protein n=1 Tax=Streptomyces sp. NBC_00557 TaxID=2975776 RepID=UPI002E81D382|nr:sigma-70 region 4 domain-containing protein [Streptomyces sp. NBC_00557]WUC39553.1 sigma-70 region 4 domain-containing protein [Streptomyces sp. NBC_00557]
MEIASSTNGLYEAILELPTRQFTVIVLRHLLGYPTKRIARYMGGLYVFRQARRGVLGS